MERRLLYITMLSARDLKNVNIFTKMDVYAVVSIKGDPYTNQKHKTPLDKDCGPNPNWNHPMQFTLHESSAQHNQLTLKIQLKSDRSFGNRDVGEVHVPIKELLENHDAASQEDKFLTYNVRTPSGKNKGTLNFSYKFGEKFDAPLMPTAAAEKAKPGVGGQPVVAYPAAGYPGATASTAFPPAGHGGYYQQPYIYAPSPQYGYGAYPHPPPPAGYGYGGYPPAMYRQHGHGGNHHGRNGGNVALGVGAGLLGGLIVGDMISDVGEMAAYDAGYDAGFGDSGFF